MFWEAVVKGLSVLTFWQFWVVVAAIVALHAVCLVIPTLFGADSFGVGVGMILLQGALEIATPILTVLALFPILALGNSFTPLPIIKIFLVPSLKIGGLAYLLFFLIHFVPIVGGIISSLNGLGSFVVGSVVFRYILSNYLKYLDYTPDHSIFPGFWPCAGFFFISAIVSFASFLALCTLTSKHDYELGSISLFTSFVAPRVLSLLPVFMYSGYAILTLTQHVKL